VLRFTYPFAVPLEPGREHQIFRPGDNAHVALVDARGLVVLYGQTIVSGESYGGSYGGSMIDAPDGPLEFEAEASE